jgi:hypothetical protein
MSLWDNQILFPVSNRCSELWDLIISAEKMQFNISSFPLYIAAVFNLIRKYVRLYGYFLSQYLVTIRYSVNADYLVEFFVQLNWNRTNKKPNSISTYVSKRIESVVVKRQLDAVMFSQWLNCGSNLYPLTDKWTGKVWCIHTIEYFSALEREEILTYATTWLNLESIILSEVR